MGYWCTSSWCLPSLNRGAGHDKGRDWNAKGCIAAQRLNQGTAQAMGRNADLTDMHTVFAHVAHRLFDGCADMPQRALGVDIDMQDNAQGWLRFRLSLHVAGAAAKFGADGLGYSGAGEFFDAVKEGAHFFGPSVCG